MPSGTHMNFPQRDDRGAAASSSSDAISSQEGCGHRPWTAPQLEELPPLRDLTLATGSGIDGDESVFP